jgi:hypothetical protein
MLRNLITFVNFFLLFVVIVWSLSVSDGIDNEEQDIFEYQKGLIGDEGELRKKNNRLLKCLYFQHRCGT